MCEIHEHETVLILYPEAGGEPIMTGQTSTASGPRELFERFEQEILGNVSEPMTELYAEDVVVETPFAPPGAPRRIEGRDEFRAFASARRASLPVRFEEVRNVVVYETTDPEVIVVEYEIVGTQTATDRSATASFIGVLRARHGQIVHWREYQDVLAIVRASGQLPALVATMEEEHAEDAAGPSREDRQEVAPEVPS